MRTALLSCPITGRSAIFTCVVITAATCLSHFASSAELKPGTQLEVVSKLPSAEVLLNFRYCPAGQAFRGKPEPLPSDADQSPAARLNRAKVVVSLKAFYISETEISQGQYRQILGQSALDRVKERVSKLTAFPIGDDEHPMLALTADEAAAFCRRLQETAIGDAGRVDSLESRRFRLPTHAEWQYACRAVTTLDAAMASPHFGGWCNLQDIPPAQIQDAKDLWKKVGGVEQFTGTQDQIAKILQTAGKSPEPDERSKAIAVLEAFLRKGLGFDRPLAKVGTVHAVNSGKPNAWSIRNMHGNVFEWTITERDSEKEQQILQFLAGSQNASVPDTKCFFLAGAGYNHQLQKNPGEWVKFAVWGGEPFDVDKGIPDPLDYPSARMDSTAIDFCPGLRVVLDRVLSPGWLVVVRKTVMVPNTLDDKVHTELARVRSVATELGGTQTELAIIKYYESLANYRLGKLSDSARDVKDAAASFPDDDSYFRLLNQLVDLDATR